jgi:hypothetical protein
LLQLILLYPIFTSIALGNQSEDIGLVGKWGEFSGNCNAVCIKGDTLFYNEGRGLKIVDFSINKESPSKYQITLPFGDVEDIKIDKKYAYILSSSNLTIINIEDLTHPIEVYRYNINNAHRILIRDTCVYIVYGNCDEWKCVGGLKVLNISKPDHPIESCHYIKENPIYDLAIENNLVYLPVGNQLQVVNIADPNNPSMVSSIKFGLDITSLVVLNGYAYVSENCSALHIINVNNPANLTESGYLAISNRCIIHDLKISGEFLYAIPSLNGDGPDDSELLVINILNPANPFIVSTLNMGDFDTAKRIALNDNLLYVAQGSSGLYIIDLSDKSTPIEKGRYKTGYTHDVVVYNKYAYLGNGSSGMSVIDISSPENPVFVRSIDLKNHAADRTTKIALDTDKICLAVDRYKDGCIDCESTIYIMDISEPGNPQVMGYYNTMGATDIELNNNMLYVSSVFDFRIVDISDPANPREIGDFKKTGSGNDIALYGQYALIADWNKGLRIIDISDPVNLKELSKYDDYCVGNVAVENNFAYIIAQSLVATDYSLRILDMSDIYNIKEIGHYPLQSYAKGLAVRNGYVSVGDAGVRIIDVTHPENPAEVAYFKTAGGVTDLLLDSQYIYLADGSDGLYIFQSDLLSSVSNNINTKPQTITLFQSYPNPFNPTTTIEFQLPSSSFVTLKVFNSTGVEIATLAEKQYTSGSYRAEWNSTAMPSGIYFYRIHAGNYTETKKMVLMR